MTYASALEIDTVAAGTSCHDFYYDNCAWASDTYVSGLCSDSTYDWSDPFLTSYALVSLYLYRDNFNPQFYSSFFDATMMDLDTANTLVFSESSDFAMMLDSVAFTPVYMHYQDTICDSTFVVNCAFSTLAYNQWSDGSVLKNPLPGQTVTDDSYQRNYKDYSILTQTPELFYYAEKADVVMPSHSITDVYKSLAHDFLYSPKIFQDVFLNYDNDQFTDMWNTPNFKKYLQFVTINVGLGGLFVELTPK